MSTSEPDTNGGAGAAAIDDALEARNIMISNRQWEQLRRIAFDQRRSMSEIVREALDAHLPAPAESEVA